MRARTNTHAHARARACTHAHCRPRTAGAQTRTTPAIKDSKNPVWNECYDFLVHSDDQLVEITLYDEDCGNDDLLGTATVKVTDLFNEGTPRAAILRGFRCQ